MVTPRARSKSGDLPTAPRSAGPSSRCPLHLPQPHFVLRKEAPLFRQPVLGWALGAAATTPAADETAKALDESRRAGQEAEKEQRRVAEEHEQARKDAEAATAEATAAFEAAAAAASPEAPAV